MRPARAIAALLLLPCAALILHCALTTSLDGLSGGSPPADAAPPPEADVVLPVADTSPPSDPCTHAVPPSRPDHDDDPSTEQTLVFAIQSLTFLKRNGTAGYDLDGVCTSVNGSAHDGGPSCTSPSGARGCDGEGGIDVGANILFATVAGFGVDLDAVLETKTVVANEGVILVLGKYNGQSDN